MWGPPHVGGDAGGRGAHPWLALVAWYYFRHLASATPQTFKAAKSRNLGLAAFGGLPVVLLNLRANRAAAVTPRPELRDARDHTGTLPTPRRGLRAHG